MRPNRHRALLPVLAGIGLLGVLGVRSGSAEATEGPVGSCISELVEYPDGSADLTNEVNGSIGEVVYDAGCVTVHSVPGKSITFKDAITYPGWTYRVKEAGGTKRKVAVSFANVEAGVRINYTIEPGRVDWRISRL